MSAPPARNRAAGAAPPALLNVREAAAVLRCSPATLYEWSRHGIVPSVRVGRLLYFSVAGLEEYLASRTRPMREPRAPRMAPARRRLSQAPSGGRG
jgi:excisionase family DNA binding protein